jgi:hypothetical protein
MEGNMKRSLPCPFCQAEIRIWNIIFAAWPTRTKCPECHAMLQPSWLSGKRLTQVFGSIFLLSALCFELYVYLTGSPLNLVMTIYSLFSGLLVAEVVVAIFIGARDYFEPVLPAEPNVK